MEKILYCDSRGDKRFSALYAKIKLKNGTLETVEHLYQKVKRDENNNPVGKGRFVHHFVLNGKTYPASYLSKYYKNLWKCYFKQNPDLLEYAMQFDKFIDRFKGKSINNQGDTIADIVKEKREEVSRRIK